MSDEQGDFEIEHVGDEIVFRFRRRYVLDEESLDWFGQSLLRAADSAVPPRIVVDFGNVKFLSSAGLGKLITLHQKVQRNGGWLKIRNLSPDIAEVFRITGIDRFLGGGDDDEGGAGVPARVRPPAPAGGGAVALPLPPPDPE